MFLSDGVVPVNVEVPDDLLAGLKEAADTASRLDADMERLHKEVR